MPVEEAKMPVEEAILPVKRVITAKKTLKNNKIAKLNVRGTFKHTFRLKF